MLRPEVNLMTSVHDAESLRVRVKLDLERGGWIE